MHHLGGIAVAVAGDLHQSNRFISILKTQLDDGAVASEQVLAESIKLFRSFNDVDFQFLAILAVTPAPLLFSFNMGGECKLLPHFGEGIVQTGSPTEFQTEMFRKMLDLLDERLPPSRPDVFLASAVAWLQSLGVRELLLQRGIGGAFCGLYADANSITWQSDVMFGLHHRLSGPVLPVITIIRDNVVIVRTGVDEASRAMWSSRSSSVTMEEWHARWGSQEDAVLGSSIRFIVLIDRIDWRVAVFEVAADGSSRYVRFDGPSRRPDGRMQMVVDFAPAVRASLMTPVQPAPSPLGTRVLFAWSPANDDPKIFQFVVEACP